GGLSVTAQRPDCGSEFICELLVSAAEKLADKSAPTMREAAMHPGGLRHPVTTLSGSSRSTAAYPPARRTIMRTPPRLLCVALGGALLTQLAACGTLFYPERR